MMKQTDDLNPLRFIKGFVRKTRKKKTASAETGSNKAMEKYSSIMRRKG